MSVALFGSASELERMLEAGLDPNSRTTGGTTLLMMASGDKDKVAALIRRGADVNLAAKTGFTPLIVAANDPDALEAIRVLVEHGAAVTPTNPKPLHDASPLFYAAWAGNVEAVRLLLERGADPRAKMNLLGIFAVTPFEMAVIQGDVAMIRALDPTPADLNKVTDTGISNLTAAVLANRVEMVRTLVAMGAKVNDVDELSMTPLMHAALVDYGDTAVLEVLLASGAERDVTSKDGLTALEFARRHGHEAAARLLAPARSGK
jgi:ankyrin repeat protein